MIACVCANVSDSTVKSLAHSGATLEVIQLVTGACCNCKCCESTIVSIVDSIRQEPIAA